MSLEFGRYIQETGLVFENRADRLKEYKAWKKQNKIYEETKTEQHHADDLDLNKIFPKFDKAGMARLKSQVTIDENKLVDLVGMDYTKSKMDLARIETEFNQLPSGVRAKFDNNPGKYHQYLSRPQKASEEVKTIVPESDTPSTTKINKEAPTEPNSAPGEG